MVRLLGFYPTAAADQYDAIKYAKRIGNYQKEVSAAYKLAAIRADLTGDRAAKREIVRSVEEWNRGAKGTGLEIRNFEKNVARGVKEARLSATQRTLRATGKAGRDETASMMEILLGD
jgi:hypothetical protein